MSLARVAIRGAYFTSIALALRQVISLATTFYVARQLLPADIGLFSMVMIVIGLAQVVGDVGITTGLVRSQDNSRSVLDTCFWIAAGLGGVLSLAVFALAPYAGVFYAKPEIVPYLRVSAAGLMINFLLPVPLAILQQRLAYKEISLAQVLGSLCGAAATVGLVYGGAGIWALVFQPIIGNVVLISMLMVFGRWFPTFQVKYSSAHEIVKSGVHLLGAGLAGYARNNFDSLVIGRELTSKDLGIYSMAQTILYAPMHLIGSTVARVMFPLLAKLQNEPERLREAVLAATSHTALLIFPLYFCLMVAADAFVGGVFGEKWVAMAPLIRILGIAWLIQSIANVSGPLMLAMGKSKMILKISLGSAAFYFVVLLLLLPYGLTAVAVGYAVANSIASIVSLLITLHYSGISVRKYVGVLVKPFLLACATVSVILPLEILIEGHGLAEFLLLVAVGCVTYGLLVFWFEKAVWQQFLRAIRN